MNEQELTDWLRRIATDIRATRSEYPLNVVRGCPIPFFGDVLKARVVTVGVNPSNMEFVVERLWLEPFSAPNWQQRLLNYFNWPSVPACDWFETWSICLELLSLSYARGEAAHIDVSPRPTTPMLDEATDATEFRTMVEGDVRWFFELLNKLPQVQLLLVAGPIPRRDGSKQQLADFIREQARTHGAEWIGSEPLPRLVTPTHAEGIPAFVCPFEPEVDGRYAMVRQVYRNRDLLRRLSRPRVSSIPILPARLDWPSAIGNFLLNYGTLDYLVFVFLKDHLSPDEFANVKEWHFKDRVSRIARFLQEAKYPAEQQTAFARLRERLEPIRELRNHLAHGHMYLRPDAEAQKPTVTLFKAKDLDTGYLPDSKHVEFAELQVALSTLTKLIEEFECLAGFRTAGCATNAQDLK